jgi:hypothetical protein
MVAAAPFLPRATTIPIASTGGFLGDPNREPVVVELRVELRGLEPLTPSLRTRCATSCATAPYGAKG